MKKNLFILAALAASFGALAQTTAPAAAAAATPAAVSASPAAAPAAADEAKARAAAAAARTAHGNAVANFQLCRSIDKVVAHYFKTEGKGKTAPAPMAACVDPGPFKPAPAVATPAAAPAKKG